MTGSTVLLRLNLHFGRFARDATGVILVGTCADDAVALAGVSREPYFTPLVDLLSVWFGWGSYLVVVSIGLAGLALLRRDQEDNFFLGILSPSNSFFS